MWITRMFVKDRTYEAKEPVPRDHLIWIARTASIPLAILFILTLCRVALGQTIHIPSPPPQLKMALLSGDVSAVDQASRALGLAPTLTTMFSAQLEYNLPEVARAARRCRDDGTVMSGGPAAAYCNLVFMSAEYAMGNARGYLAAQAWFLRPGDIPATSVAATADTSPVYELFSNAAQRMQPLSVQTTSRRSSLVAGVSSQAIETLHGSLDSTNAPMVNAALRPVVSVLINGQKVKALIDTGSPGALVVNKAVAEQLHLMPLTVDGKHVTGRMFRYTGQKSLANPTLAVVDQLQFGDIIVHNLMAIVIPKGYAPYGHGVPPAVTIGLPLLARVKRVVFTSSHVILGGSIDGCSPAVPLTFATSALEDGHLLFTATSRDASVQGSFDTGSSFLLTATRKLARKAARSNIADGAEPYGVPDPTKADVGQLAVSFGLHRAYRFQSPAALVLINVDGPGPDFFLGAPVLAEYRVQLSFGKPSLCFLADAAKSARTSSSTN